MGMLPELFDRTFIVGGVRYDARVSPRAGGDVAAQLAAGLERLKYAAAGDVHHVEDAAFERQHPRDQGGKFTEKHRGEMHAALHTGPGEYTHEPTGVHVRIAPHPSGGKGFENVVHWTEGGKTTVQEANYNQTREAAAKWATNRMWKKHGPKPAAAAPQPKPPTPNFTGQAPPDALGRVYWWRDGKRVEGPNQAEPAPVLQPAQEPSDGKPLGEVRGGAGSSGVQPGPAIGSPVSQAPGGAPPADSIDDGAGSAGGLRTDEGSGLPRTSGADAGAGNEPGGGGGNRESGPIPAVGGGAGGNDGGGAGSVGRHANPSALEAVRERTLNEPATAETPTDLSAGNWRYLSREFFGRGLKTKFNANMEALKTLQAIRLEGRTAATPAEQEIMSKFVGWGQFPAVFNDTWNNKLAAAGVDYSEWRDERDKWTAEREALKRLLTDEEWEAARDSTLNSHFTHPSVVDAHWKMAQRLGFKGGRFLETSAGIGYYLGQMPPEVAAATHTSAVELDKSTGAMLQLLYPAAHVEVTGFEKHIDPDNFYDLVASNVPFGDYNVHDERYNKYNAEIHDYFFLKSADVAKPGGLVMHITSTGTMDKQSPAIRKKLMETCDLVSAVRFPGSTHKANAGTEVVTDMLILRKRRPGEPPVDPNVTPPDAEPNKPGFTGMTTDSLGRLYHWVDGKRVPGPQWDDVVEVPDPAGGEPIKVNRYFAEHPEQILGTLDRSGTMYRADSKNVSRTDDYEARLQAAIDRLPEGVLNTAPLPNAAPEDADIRVATADIKQMGYTIQDGKLFRRQGGALIPQKVSDKAFENIAGQLGVRDAMFDTIESQRAGQDASEARKRLNSAYDAYVAKYGPLNKDTNKKLMKGDPAAAPLLALEKWDSKAKTAAKMDMFTADTITPPQEITSVKTVDDAIGASLGRFAKLDMQHMAKILGRSEADMGKEMVARGLAYEDPSRGWVQADEYLSGNVRRKLIEAKAAAAVDPRYKPNVEALLKNQPIDVPYERIGVELGANWIPGSDVQDFAEQLVGGRAGDMEVKYIPALDKWTVEWTKQGQKHTIRSGNVQRAYSVSNEKGEVVKTYREILNAVLNDGSLKVTAKAKDAKGNEITVTDEKSTTAAEQKANEIREAFAQWVWEDDARRDRLHRYYNDNINNIRNVRRNGGHQTFPGMAPEWQKKFRPMQKDSVWQIVTQGRAVMAHEVGTGKSSTMGAAAMELKRLNLANKPAILCKKANIEQMERELRELYPGANILSTVGMFDGPKRKEHISRIATGNWDVVLFTHDQMKMLPMSGAAQEKFIRQELNDLDDAIHAAELEDDSKGNQVVKQLANARKDLEARLLGALSSPKDDAISFEQTGIDFLLIDEAHVYKSLPVYSKAKVKGIPSNKSQRATDMFMRCQWLMEKNGGRGVVLATGTPVTNSLAELYNIQKFTIPNELRERGIYSFDAWRKMFARSQTKLELGADGERKPVTRLTKFVNIPELMSLSRISLDVQRADKQRNPDGSPQIIRPKRTDTMVMSPDNPERQAMMKELFARGQRIKGKRSEKGGDNIMVIGTDGSKAAVDMRLYKPTAKDDPESKANKCVANVLELYQKHPGKTQLIFSNVGVGDTKWGFNLYQDMIDKMVKGGIPREQIADFSNLEGEAKEAAQAGLQNASIRVAIGSTETLGTGVNCQKHLRVLHHLDVPYTPAAIEQRDGRGWRSGNTNKELDVLRYAAQKSLDEMRWGIVDSKKSFVDNVMSGDDNTTREMTEVDTEELTPAQLAAAISGNPKMLRRLQLEEDIKQVKWGGEAHMREQKKLQQTVGEIEQGIEATKGSLSQYNDDIRHLEGQPEFHAQVGTKAFTDRKEAGEALQARAAELEEEWKSMRPWERDSLDPVEVGSYRGMKVYRNPKWGGGAYHVAGPSGQTYATGDSLASIEAVIRGLPKKRQEAEESIPRMREDLERVKGKIGRPYANATKLAELQAELKGIEAELVAESKPPKPPGEKEQAETMAGYRESDHISHKPTTRPLKKEDERRPAKPEPEPEEATKPASEPDSEFGAYGPPTRAQYDEYVTAMRKVTNNIRDYDTWHNDVAEHRRKLANKQREASDPNANSPQWPVYQEYVQRAKSGGVEPRSFESWETAVLAARQRRSASRRAAAKPEMTALGAALANPQYS